MQAVYTGFLDALSLGGILGVVSGVFLGYLIGVLPGLNRSTALALSIPVTMYLSPVAALGFLIGTAKGSASGGAVTAILINTPGEPASAATCIDGYPMSRRGRPRSALRVAMFASFFGDIFGTLLLVGLAAPAASLALKIGPVELLAIFILALTFVSALSEGALVKGIISAALGVFIGCVGLDIESGLPRMTFGFVELYDGVPLAAVSIGMLALTEMIFQIAQPDDESDAMQLQHAAPQDRLTGEETKNSLIAMLRGSVIGSFVGIVPGLGASIGSFMSYTMTKQASKSPERFGKGAPEGVAAAESADNAVVPASLIPLFSLGIPGSVSAALLLGAFIIHGVTPGPLMFVQHPSVVYGVYFTMILASLVMLPMGLMCLPLFARVVAIPLNILVPAVIFVCLAGAYLESASMFGVYLTIAFGVVGVVFRLLGLNIISFLIGFVLAPAMELSLRQTLVLTDGRPEVFLQHWGAIAILAFTALSVSRIVLKQRRPKRATS